MNIFQKALTSIAKNKLTLTIGSTGQATVKIGSLKFLVDRIELVEACESAIRQNEKLKRDRDLAKYKEAVERLDSARMYGGKK